MHTATNLFDIFRETLDESEEGIAINGPLINSIIYADDTVLLADSAQRLQMMMVVETWNQ